MRQLTGASPADELLGAAFTAAAVEKAGSEAVPRMHFATHALLPTDLRCQTEPALVTSESGRRPGCHRRAADGVGRGGDQPGCRRHHPLRVQHRRRRHLSGESLTGLARSFFYAGARALLVTHWSVNDRTTAYLVALTLQGANKDRSQGLAGALAVAQRRILGDAKGELAFRLTRSTGRPWR